MPAQFVTDSKGRKTAVILSVREYERLMEMHEELSAIRAFDKAISGPLSFDSAEKVFDRIERKRASA
jgi:PHD/YefM family antitoxin component YafN of YafNO toxin-antitoxin module